MKKLLSIALCAAAITSFAADEAVQIADVGVLSVTIPANQANTIIAASFKDLSDSTKDVSIADMVKTTNLAAGDKLLLFTGSGTYTAWVLGSDGKWAAAEKTYTVNANGELVEGTGASASTTVTAGTGLWIVRGAESAKNEAKIAIYGAYTSAAKSTATTAGAWNLIGNPGLVAKTIKDGAATDAIIKVVNGANRTYHYNATKKTWYYEATGTKTVKNQTVRTSTTTDENPAIDPGQGFWYYTKDAVTISWTDTAESSSAE